MKALVEIGIDPQKYRLAMARVAASSETIDSSEADPVEMISNAVHLQRGNIRTFHSAVSAVRGGGVVTVVGGQAPVHACEDQFISLVVDRKLRTDDIITHRLRLADAPHAYEIFNRKEEGCVKVVRQP